jgi:hypothetical protein
MMMTSGHCEVVDEPSAEKLFDESLDVLIDHYLMLGDDSFGMLLLEGLESQRNK